MNVAILRNFDIWGTLTGSRFITYGILWLHQLCCAAVRCALSTLREVRSNRENSALRFV